MSDELFAPETVQQDSPRLAWMKRHGIITLYHAPGHCPPTWFAGFQRWHPELRGVDFFAHETAHNGGSRVGEGESEDEALGNLMTCGEARAAKMRLWNEESPIG